MKPIDVTSLRDFARTLEGKPLTTRARGCTFHVQVIDGGLVYTPESSGKPRPQQDRDIERVLERFRETASFRNVDYTDLTVSASYLLAIVGMFLHSGW
jgi:hypothetical protein